MKIAIFVLLLPNTTGMNDKKSPLDLAREPEVLTIEQAAGYLGLHSHTIRQAIKAGQFSAVLIGKRKYLLRDELMRYLKKF